jgi:membrane-associated protein
MRGWLSAARVGWWGHYPDTISAPLCWCCQFANLFCPAKKGQARLNDLNVLGQYSPPHARFRHRLQGIKREAKGAFWLCSDNSTPMELLTFLIDFILHVDKHLETFVATYGVWVYVLLFLVIFVETGVVVMPFLPGDSLLFVVGAMCGVGLMDYPLSVGLLLVAAILGDQTNFTIGRYFGPKVFKWENSRFFNKAAFDAAHAYYQRYGGVTIISARFLPFLRTFAPFVAGVAEMPRARFTFFNVVGAALWVGGIVTVGYFFGNFPWVKANLDKIIWAMILIPGLVIVAGALRARYKAAA